MECLILVNVFGVFFSLFQIIGIYYDYCYAAIIIIINTATTVFNIFYTGNQCNYLITYYSFKCYVLAEHLVLP